MRNRFVVSWGRQVCKQLQGSGCPLGLWVYRGGAGASCEGSRDWEDLLEEETFNPEVQRKSRSGCWTSNTFKVC